MKFINNCYINGESLLLYTHCVPYYLIFSEIARVVLIKKPCFDLVLILVNDFKLTANIETRNMYTKAL